MFFFSCFFRKKALSDRGCGENVYHFFFQKHDFSPRVWWRNFAFFAGERGRKRDSVLGSHPILVPTESLLSVKRSLGTFCSRANAGVTRNYERDSGKGSNSRNSKGGGTF